jgi:hypothetical protein
MFAAVLLATAHLAYSAQEEPCAKFHAEKIKPPVTAAEILTRLKENQRTGCILGTTDTTDVQKLTQQLFQPNSSIDTAVIRTQLSDAMLHEFDGLPASICEAPNDAACMVGRHVQQLRALRQKLLEGSQDRTDPLLSINNWTLHPFTAELPISKIGLQSYLVQECSASVTALQCAAAVSLAAKVMRTSLATDQLIAAYNLPIIDANKRFLSLRDKEWDSYFNDVSVQYPWELGWNSVRFSKAHKADAKLFPRAPNSKLIALHPSAALERVELPTGESGTLAALVVELVGYESWHWRAGEATNRWGASLIASIADVPGMDAMGYGVLFHTPIRNVSIGAVRRDGDAGSEVDLVINVDFAQLIQEYSQMDLVDFLAPQSE